MARGGHTFLSCSASSGITWYVKDVDMSKRLIVGGVPEHFNLPWYRANERQLFAGDDIEYDWRVFPGGTGAMLAALENDEIDVAVLLTEGVVAHIASGKDAAILGTYVKSPLLWGIHVHHDSPFQEVDELKGATFGISRYHSGSHIMSFVLARQMGWDPRRDVNLSVVKNLVGAQEALHSGQADAFLWEKYTTKPVVDAGEWRRIDVTSPPWSPFVLASKQDFAQTRRADLERVVHRINGLLDEMRANRRETIEAIAERFGLLNEDVDAWLGQTQWDLKLDVDVRELDGVIATLVDVGVIDRQFPADRLLSTPRT